MTDAERTNILIVDDLPEKLLVYTSVLEDLGQTLVTARSGAEALEQVLRTEFAVILLDVNMPGMDGFETAGLIRRRKRSAHTPIIFLTAFTDDVRAAEGYAHGAVDYMTTPVVPAVLRAKVRVFVDLYRMTQRVRRQAEERAALAAAEEATRRAAFLADVSRALADSLDPDTTARTVARQAVPFLADLAGLTLAGEHGPGWRTKLAWTVPPDPDLRVRWVSDADAPTDALRAAVDRALAGGRPELLPDLDVPYPDTDADIPAARVRSAVVAPLKARGRTVGALTLAYGPSGRRHGPAELALADDLAGRAAIALDNARLYRAVETADRQKNEFLSMLAHELRNPLAPIRNAVEVLRLVAPDRPEVDRVTGMIRRQVGHMVRLVDDLLDVSRITRGKIRLKADRVDLAAVVGQAVEAARPLLDQAGHRLEVDLPAGPVWVDGDPTRLAQVFTNLLNNAAKYTPEGGAVRLAVAAAGGRVEVRVRDTGVGIPADMLAAVFDLFTQVDRTLDRSLGGLGIGLTLVKRLVELHGGSVAALSDGPGTGSEFVVRLPLAAGPPAAAPAARPAAAGGRLDVLLVDDNVDGADSLAALLRLAGHTVRVAYDGPTGLAAAVADPPDVVILDIGLPGLDGYAVSRQLRDRPGTRQVTRIALSGYGREEDRERGLAAGIDAYLVKPVTLDALNEALARVPGRVTTVS